MSETKLTSAILPVYNESTNSFMAIEIPSCKDITDKFTKNVLAFDAKQNNPIGERQPQYLLRDNGGKSVLLQEVTRNKMPWYNALQIKPSESRLNLLNIINGDIIKKVKNLFKVELAGCQVSYFANGLENVTQEIAEKKEKIAKEKAEKAKEKATAKMLKDADKKHAKEVASKKSNAKKSTKKNTGTKKSRVEKATQEQAKRIAKNLESTVYNQAMTVPKAIPTKKATKKSSKKS